MANTNEKISIKSGKLEIVSTTTDIKLNSNTYIHLGAKEGVFIDIGNIDGDNKINSLIINAPSIELGLNKPGYKQEPIVKGDILEQKLTQIINIIEDLAYQTRLICNPDSKPHAINLYNNILAETTQVKKELKDIKSKVSKTI
jgi:hypothetical protein